MPVLLRRSVRDVGNRPVAMVTGASRGIGRATAIALARRGYDLVLTARDAAGGARWMGSSVSDVDVGVALPGTVAETAAATAGTGAEVLAVSLDLTDRATVAAAAEAALDHFGRVDVVVSNAIYQGPGLTDRFGQAPIELMERALLATALAPVVLFDRLVPLMAERGDGVVINVTSGAATLNPRPGAPWGLGYAMAKGAAHRIPGVLHAEVGDRGVRCYNLNPGHVVTEIAMLREREHGVEARGQSPWIPATAIEWLVCHPAQAAALAGQEVVAASLVREHGLTVPEEDT